eukprot:5481424-Amphidinium_carterae.1
MMLPRSGNKNLSFIRATGRITVVGCCVGNVLTVWCSHVLSIVRKLQMLKCQLRPKHRQATFLLVHSEGPPKSEAEWPDYTTPAS